MSDRPYKLDNVFEEQRALAESLGIRAWTEEQARKGESREERRRRTSTHEAGHAFVHVLSAVRFAFAELLGDDHGRTFAPRGSSQVQLASVEARIACDLGGPVAEEVVLAAADPNGAWHDLTIARARADLPFVREQAGRVRQLLTEHRAALERLASSLSGAGHLTADECRDELRKAGVEVPSPRFDVSPPPEEWERCAAACRQMQATIDANPLSDEDLAKLEREK